MSNPWPAVAVDPGDETGMSLYDPQAGLQYLGLTNVEKGIPGPVYAWLHDSRGHRALPGVRVVIECPMIYPGETEINPNDMVSLARKVGKWEEKFRAIFQHWAGFVCQIEVIHPRDWKGQTKKEMNHERTLETLNWTERSYAVTELGRVAKGYRHNMLDAAGIGLWAMGRTVKKTGILSAMGLRAPKSRGTR